VINTSPELEESIVSVQRPESEAKIAGMFDRIAPRYDFLNRLLSGRQDQRWRNHLVRHVPYRPGGTYLDVATGTGDVLKAVYKTRDEYSGYMGVDISQQMLNLATKKCAGRGITFDKMSAENLKIPDASVDALSISFGLRNVVRKGAALNEFHRVLKDDGVLLILEFFIPKTGIPGFLFQTYFHYILPAIGGLFSDKSAYTYLPQSVGSFYSPDQIREELYNRGFVVGHVKNFLFGACRLIKATKVRR
jgi:demethylmenaquinone methyltransferase/2-methoxy-6-polyprenyl-1,4-benzoquinol methylase